MDANDSRELAKFVEFLLGCAEAAYLPCDRPKVEEFMARNQLRSQEIVVGNARAVLFMHKDFIVVSGAGSNDPKDWKQNAKFFKKMDFIGGRVAAGFLEHFLMVRKPLVRAIRYEFNQSARPIYLTGHSLFGAVCYQLAMKLAQEGIPWELCVTAGAPRPGDKAFADSFDSQFAGKLIQLRNKADAVPCLPPYLMGYRHIRSGVAVVALNGQIKRGMGSFWQTTQRAARIAAAHVTLSGLRVGEAVSVEDHKISEYRKAVSASLDSLDDKATEWAG
jgi:hypothetical protein